MAKGLIESDWAMRQAGNFDAAIRIAKQVLQSGMYDDLRDFLKKHA